MGFDKSKVITRRFLFYEFLGTFLITVSFILEREYWGILLLAMIISWDHSAAHFNSALTFAEFIFRSDNFADACKGLTSLLSIFGVQILAATIGWAICLAIVHVEVVNN